MKKRNYRIVHESYLTEYLGITYPPGTWKTNVPLGKVKVPEHLMLTPEEKAYATKPLRPVCDAVVLLSNEVHIIEAKIRDERGKVEQLLLYEYLFRQTPEFKPFWKFPIRKILLTPKDQGNFVNFLKKYGIEVVYYRPAWIIEYIGTLDRRYRRGTYYSVSL